LAFRRELCLSHCEKNIPLFFYGFRPKAVRDRMTVDQVPRMKPGLNGKSVQAALPPQL
jgi:hypothetical protein